MVVRLLVMPDTRIFPLRDIGSHVLVLVYGRMALFLQLEEEVLLLSSFPLQGGEKSKLFCEDRQKPLS